MFTIPLIVPVFVSVIVVAGVHFDAKNIHQHTLNADKAITVRIAGCSS